MLELWHREGEDKGKDNSTAVEGGGGKSPVHRRSSFFLRQLSLRKTHLGSCPATHVHRGWDQGIRRGVDVLGSNAEVGTCAGRVDTWGTVAAFLDHGVVGRDHGEEACSEEAVVLHSL